MTAIVSRRPPPDHRQFQRCMLLAVLLHVWLVLMFGNATGTAAPGQGADAVTALFTTKISSRQVREHAPSIRRAPGIFQELITAVRE